MNNKCKLNADKMNDDPNPRQMPITGYAREKVNDAEDHAKYALKFLEEIIYHRITPEEIIRNVSIGIAEINKVKDELHKAKLAGKSKSDLEE